MNAEPTSSDFFMQAVYGLAPRDLLVILIPVTIIVIGGTARALVEKELSFMAFSLGAESCLVAITECFTAIHDRLHVVLRYLIDQSTSDIPEVRHCVEKTLVAVVLLLLGLLALFCLSVVEKTVNNWADPFVEAAKAKKEPEPAGVRQAKFKWVFLLGNAIGSAVLISVLFSVKEV